MKEIQLTNYSKTALVEDEDFEVISQYKWYAWVKRYHDGKINVEYAFRSIKLPNGKRSTISMHRTIMGLKHADLEIDHYLEIDHINTDGLDNRRSNLRIVTKRENYANSRKQPFLHGKPTSSQYKGVSWNKKRLCWTAQAQNIHIGSFASEEEAARAYDETAIQLYGEFARLNFPEDFLLGVYS
jgi:HNH endonuclease/AP2 domain